MGDEAGNFSFAVLHSTNAGMPRCQDEQGPLHWPQVVHGGCQEERLSLHGRLSQPRQDARTASQCEPEPGMFFIISTSRFGPPLASTQPRRSGGPEAGVFSQGELAACQLPGKHTSPESRKFSSFAQHDIPG